MKPMIEKLKENEPYNLFFTTVADFPETSTQKNAVTFTDLLCPSLGELKCSLQLNFLVAIDWLMEQYDKMGQGKKPLTVMYGYEVDCEEEYGERYSNTEEYIKENYPNVQSRFIKTKDSYGIHHSKIGIYIYKDNSLRIVISTANLYSVDWNFYCNGLWISPLCPSLPESSRDTAGAGPTNFKPALLSYLSRYKDSLMDEWIEYIKRADFSAVKVCLVTSAPGLHKPTSWPIAHSHLHSVGKLLSLHCKLPGASPICDEDTSTRSSKATGVSKGTRTGQWTTARDRTIDAPGISTTGGTETTMSCDESTTTERTGRNNIVTVEHITNIINRINLRSNDNTPNVSAESTSEEGASAFPTEENVTSEQKADARDESLSWEIIAQASSIGYIGNSPNDWLSTALLRSLASHTHCRLPSESNATIKIIYPTQNDILNGHHGAGGGGCLAYWMNFNQEHLKWPIKYLYSWKADDTNRSKATPHIKSYCRISPCLTKLAWFCLTSANISKSAWGSGINKDGSIYVRSYEAGVLFLPKYFGETYFHTKLETCNEAVKLFPLIYDLPLKPYGPEDVPCNHSKEI